MSTKPSIVFAHGLWADGSCYSKVISLLIADGFEVLGKTGHALRCSVVDYRAIDLHLRCVDDEVIVYRLEIVGRGLEDLLIAENVRTSL